MYRNPNPRYLHTQLSPQYKRQRKSSSEPLDDTKRSFLNTLLTVILQKLKWDEEADPEDIDEDDRAAFEDLRKVSIWTYDNDNSL